jgi:hypothetical protein
MIKRYTVMDDPARAPCRHWARARSIDGRSGRSGQAQTRRERVADNRDPLQRAFRSTNSRASTAPPGSYEWTLVAPEAQLFDTGGNRIGRHFGGPSWQNRTMAARSWGHGRNGPTRRQRCHSPGCFSPQSLSGTEGSFSKVTSVLRVNTVGGIAPRSGCSQATAGASARMDYTANYYFFDARLNRNRLPYTTPSY